MVPVPKINSLVGKQWGPVTWEGDVEEDSIDTENFELSDSQGIISPEVVVSLTSTEDVLTPSPLEILTFPPLTEEIHFPLFDKPEVKQHNTVFFQHPPILVSGLLIELKANQAPKEEIESVVYEEVCHTTEELNEFAISFEQKYGLKKIDFKSVGYKIKSGA